MLVLSWFRAQIRWPFLKIELKLHSQKTPYLDILNLLGLLLILLLCFYF